MEDKQLKSAEVSLDSLDLRYANTRVAKTKLLDMLTNSMERFGQITPVLTVAQEGRMVLIHGYIRFQGLKRIGRDTIMADVQELSEEQVLLELLSDTQGRQWEAVEQEWIVRDLKDRFRCSLREIARGIGYDASWVERRLSLIEGLPEDVLRSVCSGQISTHAATRVLVPLARANTDRARKLVEHLGRNPLSTRELATFLKHYEAFNTQTRKRMISDPSLFVKARKSKADKADAHKLHKGPGGSWSVPRYFVFVDGVP
ncbi:ParB/RepB/Spo0J family partition protein [Thermodesulfobacteriota bacterium]